MPHLKSITQPQANQLLFLFIVLFFIVLATIIPHVDFTLTQELHNNAWPSFEDFFSRTLFEGDLPGAGDLINLGMITAVVLYFWANFRPRQQFLTRWRPSLGFAVFGALVSSVCFVHGTKWALGRARPGAVFKHHLAYSDWFEFGSHFISEGSYRGSFPSGHTSGAFLLILLAYILAGDSRHSRRTRIVGWCLGVIAFLFAGSMAIARSMAFSHWISDGILGMLLVWALIHAIYFWILRIPEQNLYYTALTNPRSLPLLWELRLGIWVAGLTLGLVCFIFGMRAIFLPVSSGYILLLPVGIFLLWIFSILARRLYRQFSLRLQDLKDVNGVRG